MVVAVVVTVGDLLVVLMPDRQGRFDLSSRPHLLTTKKQLQLPDSVLCPALLLCQILDLLLLLRDHLQNLLELVACLGNRSDRQGTCAVRLSMHDRCRLRIVDIGWHWVSNL